MLLVGLSERELIRNMIRVKPLAQWKLKGMEKVHTLYTRAVDGHQTV